MPEQVGDYSHLPGLLAEIAEAAGLDAAMKIAEAAGGRRMYFSPVPKPDSLLFQTVGAEAARKIGKTIATSTGVELHVPHGPMGARARQWCLIRRMIEAGATVREIVRVTGVARSTVYKHKAACRTEA